MFKSFKASKFTNRNLEIKNNLILTKEMLMPLVKKKKKNERKRKRKSL